MATRAKQLYEGKSKILFETDDPGLLVQHFKDDATAFNGIKKGTIVDKGIFNCLICTSIYTLLEKEGVPTAMVERLSEREMLVRRVEIVPIEFVVRNRIAGSLAKRYGLPEGGKLARPLVEFFVKSDPLGDPLITGDAAELLGLADRETLALGARKSLRVNTLLIQFFGELGIDLVDFKLEFGRAEPGGELLLADEITPDGCRLWDSKTGEKLDKDRFRRDLGNVEESYRKVANLVSHAVSGAGAGGAA
jgi:phosphoribosylaminoimidazole-succinocarboxamide synthase